jgi:iron complex outermembrane receptor protein
LVSDAQPTDPVSCTGLRFNCNTSTQLWAVSATADRSPVSETVSEGALEVDMPLITDAFLAKHVSVNGAARYTYYNTSGSAVTWKAGLDWRLNEQLTLRATRSRDIRAPTLNDLYLPTSLSTIQVTDLLTGQTQVVPLQAGGNAHLVPEVGYTTTAGFVYRPEWLPSFSLTLDGFWIKITKAITNLQGTNPTVQAICYASGGTSSYCSLQQRPNGFTDTSAANAVTKWYNEQINIASQSTRGADLEANYSATPFSHPLSLRALATYQPHIIYTTPGLTTIDVAGVAFAPNALQASPVWRATFVAKYNPVQNFAITVMERWRSSLAWTGDPTQNVATPRIPSVAYTDLNISYQLKRSDSQTELFFNVQNLFNKQPPAAAFLGANGAVGYFGGFAYGDDPVGAYFTVGLRYRR